MGQFDVHANPGRARQEVPFLVIIQSSRFAETPRRLAIPLVREAVFGRREASVNPVFTIDGITVVLDTLDTATVPARVLGPPVANLSEEGEAIIAAIDEVISRAYD